MYASMWTCMCVNISAPMLLQGRPVLIEPLLPGISLPPPHPPPRLHPLTSANTQTHRGWLHEATTNATSHNLLQRVGSSELLRLAHGHGSASLHLTVGIEAQRCLWVHVLHQIVAVLADDSVVTRPAAVILHLALCDAARELVALRASLSAGKNCVKLGVKRP